MSAQTINIFSVAMAATGSYMFFSIRALRYLRYFQQEDYLAHRFLRWYQRCGAFDRKGSSVAFLVATVSLLLPKYGSLVEYGTLAASIIGAGALISIAFKEENPLTSGKITLKVTARAKRITILASMLYIVAIFCTTAVCYRLFPAHPAQTFWFGQILLFQLPPVCLVLANWLLTPYEKRIQATFAHQAADKINNIKPYVIGITGSYGKTSTKVILGQILNNASPAFYPPRSINTYMGITREIRERLEPAHKFAVIEMAAYQRGSIAKLCKLAPPRAGIITAIGEMHMERFGSKEQVYLTKSELAQAIPQSGTLIVNGDNEMCRKVAQEYPKKLTLIYGMDESKGSLDAHLYDTELIEDGRSKFRIKWKGISYEGNTALLGKHMLSNVLASFTMACALGLKPEFVLAAIRNIKPESNRLEQARVPISTLSAFTGSLKKPEPGQKLSQPKPDSILLPAGNGSHKGNVVRLNDAYNSNPVGFAAALEVLGQFPGTGRKVLVTPGMVELGALQAAENKKAAAAAAGICDLVLVVGSVNQKALIDGLREGGLEEIKYKAFDSMRDALAYLGNQYLKDGDMVLIENDLTDLYEGTVRF